MQTTTLTVCDGRINSGGFCEKCWQPAQTTSSHCGRLVETKPTETNTVLAVSGQDIKDLIFAIGYTLDAIDVRATDPRRYEAKEKAAKILEQLVSRVCQNEAVAKAGE
jgi:hypothetical protein